MNDLLLSFLSLFASGTPVAPLLRRLKPALRKRTSRTWQYYIYLVVLLHLLIPLSPAYSLLGMVLDRTQEHPFREVATHTDQALVAPPMPAQVVLPDDKQIYDGTGNQNEPERPSPGIILSLQPWLWRLWLVPAVLLFVRKFGYAQHSFRIHCKICYYFTIIAK